MLTNLLVIEDGSDASRTNTPMQLSDRFSLAMRMWSPRALTTRNNAVDAVDYFIRPRGLVFGDFEEWKS